jgi:hypothetical protein
VGELALKNVVFFVFSVAVLAKYFEACGRRNSISGRVVRRQRVPGLRGIDCFRPEIDGKYGG